MNSASFQSIDDLDNINYYKPQNTNDSNHVNQQETNYQTEARTGLQTNSSEFAISKQCVDTFSAGQPQRFTTFSGKDLWPI
jgi:hypothetical protein